MKAVLKALAAGVAIGVAVGVSACFLYKVLASRKSFRDPEFEELSGNESESEYLTAEDESDDEFFSIDFDGKDSDSSSDNGNLEEALSILSLRRKKFIYLKQKKIVKLDEKTRVYFYEPDEEPNFKSLATIIIMPKETP